MTWPRALGWAVLVVIAYEAASALAAPVEALVIAAAVGGATWRLLR